MKAMPKAQPPSTMCHQNGTPNQGLVDEPIALNSSAIAMVPSVDTRAIVRHEPTLVTAMMIAPIRQASAEVSPIEPGSRPMNAFHQEKPACSNGSRHHAHLPKQRGAGEAVDRRALRHRRPDLVAGDLARDRRRTGTPAPPAPG